MERAVNLCDLGHRILKSDKLAGTIAPYQSVYIGSYFCDRYFLLTCEGLLKALKPQVNREKKHVTLVIPVPSQSNLCLLKKTLDGLLRRYARLIDRIVVNDYGMLQWVHRHYPQPIILGRLFSKPLRDPRYPDTLGAYQISQALEEIIAQYNCLGIEAEGCFQNISKTTENATYGIYVHKDFYYISCMRQCFFASIDKPAPLKFRYNGICNLQCAEFRLRNNISPNITIDRIGKGVYFLGEFSGEGKSGVNCLIETPIEKW